MPVRRSLPLRFRPVHQTDDPALEEGRQYPTKIIRAAILIKIKVLDAHAEVKDQPFLQVRRLVAEDRAGREVILQRPGQGGAVARLGAQLARIPDRALERARGGALERVHEGINRLRNGRSRMSISIR